MDLKKALMSVFKDPGILFRYKLKNLETNEVVSFEESNKNIFKHTKWIFNHRMDKNLKIRLKGIDYVLVNAEMVDSIETDFSFDLTKLNKSNLVSIEPYSEEAAKGII